MPWHMKTSVTVGDPAPDLSLPDQDGEEIRFSNLWHRQPLILVFLRHLG